MTFLKSKRVCAAVLTCLLATCAAQAGIFGVSGKDKKAYQAARDTFASGNYPLAIEELSDYIYQTNNIKRREARAYRLLGLSYEMLSKPDKALEVYLEALEFHPKNIPVLLAAASLYQSTGLTDRSIELYNRVLEQEPDNQEALSGQAQNYVRIGFYSQARKHYDRFFEINPKAPAVNRARYANAFYLQRDYSNALINITMAKTEDDQNPDYWLLSAKAHKGLGRHTDALSDLDVALLLAPQRRDLLATKALWLYQQGVYMKSLDIAAQILRQDPDNELALFIEYLDFARTSRKAEARERLTRIQQLNNNTFIHRLSDRLLNQAQEPSPTTDLSLI